jgi:C4-dicarboxylate-specific signal transduction histidine kinase
MSQSRRDYRREALQLLKGENTMQTGTAYYAIQIDSFTLKNNLPKPEYLPTLRKLQADLKTALNNKTQFKTEQAASEAFSELPQNLQAASAVIELTPVFGIL